MILEIVLFVFGLMLVFGGYYIYKPKTKETPPLKVTLPAAKVAIVGAGIGGCSAAYFLRELGGDVLDITVFTNDKVGGRLAVVDVDGKEYEAGASIFHTSNRYMATFREKFGLTEFSMKNVPTTPLGIFNGQRFVLELGYYSIINTIRLLWAYGLSLLDVPRKVKDLLSKFVTIYDIQATGTAFRTVPDMITAMCGENVFKETQVTAEEYFLDKLKWNRNLVDELICCAMKANYGQNNKDLDAFTAFVSLAGMEVKSLWNVVGGNYQIPLKALESSKATLVQAEVTSVTRNDDSAKMSYTVTYKKQAQETSDPSPEEGLSTDFDIVIIAHPLNLSTITFENFPMQIYTPAAKTPYHRTVATFVKGEVNGAMFGLKGSAYPTSFPLDILTNDLVDSPVDFNSVSTQIPVDIKDTDTKDFCKPLNQEPTRVWKVFSKSLLTAADKSQLFRSIESEVTKDWLAYPHYHPPEEYPPFLLDGRGLIYINAIEKVASAAEMSCIGGKNAALLAKDYLLASTND